MPGSFVIPSTAQQRFFKAPAGWNDVWRAAIANSASQQAIWGIMGDSNSSGFDSLLAQYQSATNWWTRRWTTQLAAKLEARAPGGRSGEYFQPAVTDNTNFPGQSHHTGPAWIAPAGQVGGGFLLAYAGGFQQVVTTTAASGVGWVWQFNSANVGTGLSFTDVDILNVDLNGGTFHYRVDAGASVADTTVTTQNNSGVPATYWGYGYGRVVRRQISGLSNATHTIDFGNTSGIQAMQLAGLNCYPSNAARTKGVFTANYSLPGYSMGALSTAGGANFMEPEVWSGINGAIAFTAATNAAPIVLTVASGHGVVAGNIIRVAVTTGAAAISGEYKVASVTTTSITLDNTVAPGGTASAGFITFMVPQLGPPVGCHMLVIFNYANDMQLGTGLDAAYESTRRLVLAARRSVDQCGLLFICHNIPDPRSNEVNFALDNVQNWWQYMDMIVSLSDAFGGAIYNFGADVGQIGVTKGYENRGDLHLTDSGHTYLANQLAPILVP